MHVYLYVEVDLQLDAHVNLPLHLILHAQVDLHVGLHLHVHIDLHVAVVLYLHVDVHLCVIISLDLHMYMSAYMHMLTFYVISTTCRSTLIKALRGSVMPRVGRGATKFCNARGSAMQEVLQCKRFCNASIYKCMWDIYIYI